MTSVPTPEDIYKHPLMFVSDTQRKLFRNKVIKISALFMCLGFVLLYADLLLFTYTGISFSDGLNATPGAGTRANRLFEGTSLMLLLVEFGALPFGIYKLITIRKQMSRLALKYLATNNIELQQMLDNQKTAARNRFNSRVSSSANVLTKIFIFIIALFLLFSVAMVVWALFRR